MTTNVLEPNRSAASASPLDSTVARRIAIVGGGPRGTFCLSGLVDALLETGARMPLAVDVYETAEHYGAGAVYRPGQPDFRIMNYPSGQIDVWPSESVRQRRPGELSLPAWLRRHYPSRSDPAACVPRSVVGAYLRDAFDKVVAVAPRSIAIRVIPERVDRIKRHGQSWRLSAAALAGRDTREYDTRGYDTRDYDEVLLTVGHGPPEQAECTQQAIDGVESGSRVAMRGFALTFIDACLDLTQGRGGRFVRRGGKLVYLPSGREPGAILPSSRSGRPMLAKPSYDAGRQRSQALTGGVNALDDLIQNGGCVSFVDDIGPIIVQTAAGLYRRDHPRSSHAAAIDGRSDGWFDGWFDAWLEQPTHPTAVRRRMYDSCQGQPPSKVARLDRAFGDSWRGLYPKLVKVVGHGLLTDDSWADFWMYAKEFERVAFGPPAMNAEKLIALVDAKLVDLSHLQSPAEADFEIDCVVPSPHTIAPGSLLDQLLRSGHARRDPCSGGIETRADGAAIGRNGATTEGLAIIGRATEGRILGNDTLSRTMHAHPVAWGRAVVQRTESVYLGTNTE